LQTAVLPFDSIPASSFSDACAHSFRERVQTAFFWRRVACLPFDYSLILQVIPTGLRATQGLRAVLSNRPAG
jgi:hypothetical protein